MLESKENLEGDGGIKNGRVGMQQNERLEQEVQEICRRMKRKKERRERRRKVWGVRLGRRKAVDDHCEDMAVLRKTRKERRQTAKNVSKSSTNSGPKLVMFLPCHPYEQDGGLAYSCPVSFLTPSPSVGQLMQFLPAHHIRVMEPRGNSNYLVLNGIEE